MVLNSVFSICKLKFEMQELWLAISPYSVFLTIMNKILYTLVIYHFTMIKSPNYLFSTIAFIYK